MPKVDANDLAASVDQARFKETVSALTAQAKAEQDEYDLGKPYDFNGYESFDPENDPDCLVGKRWLYKGGSCIISADAGSGKSALLAQMGVLWICQKPFFGITPKKKMKCAMLEEENNTGDTHEFMQGILPGTGLSPFIDHIKKNFFIYEVNPRGGGEGLKKSIIKLNSKHRGLDIIFVDPIFRFAGCSISDQEKMTAFFSYVKEAQRQTGCAIVFAHHNGRMRTQEGQSNDQSNYFGSVELEAWPRATMALKKIEDRFELVALKRGERAGLTDSAGNPARCISIRHSTLGICWVRGDDKEQLHTADGLEMIWLPALSKDLWQTENELRDRMRRIYHWTDDNFKIQMDKFKSTFDAHDIQDEDGMRDAGKNMQVKSVRRKFFVRLKP